MCVCVCVCESVYVYVYVSVSLCHFFLRHWHVCLYLLDSEEEEEEEEEIRDEQGRILHGYLSKEELAAMQEALADESIPKLDTQQILDLKESRLRAIEAFKIAKS